MFSDKLQLSLINNTVIRNSIGESEFSEGQAGFVKNGQFAWIVRDSTLEILSTESGSKIAHYNFGKHHGGRSCIITCVEEIDYLPGVCLLTVATEFTASGASTGVISVFCVQGSKIIGSMDFCERITCCRYIQKSACQRSVLRNFHGTLAIGTDQGKLFLIDLMIPTNAHEISSSPSFECELFPCINVLASVDQAQIAATHHKVSSSDQRLPEKSFFSIQLEVLTDSGAVLSILCMPNLYTMAVGLSDGRLVLYDLSDLQAFHLAYPPDNRTPLTHMSFLEPTDDPRCAVYIWAFHTSNDGAIAVMHSLMYANRINKVYEDFKSCCVRLTMPMHVKETFPICCRSIMRTLTQEDEDILTLNVFAWTTASKKTNIMIFDLNQWYKEEMPNVGDWRLQLKYAAVFELQNCSSLDVIMNEHSVFPFNSILRPEEHFYPNSLSFDVCVLENDKFSHYRWFGLQNIVLQQFNVIGPQIILEPSYYFNELLQVAIIPQFSDAVYSVLTPIGQKREFLLSVALEYNFNGFLKKCAWAWADGSYLGKDDSPGIGLSTLTDWIWNRARAIKDVCNSLCRPLFDYSEQRIDYGTQKQLSQCCKQLKVLSELLLIILKDYRHFIPEHITAQLKTQSETIRMASDYQEVLQWLLNVGLLPEGHYNPNHRNQQVEDDFVIVPYPYQTINSYYETQRMKLADEWMGEAMEQQFEDSSRYLFIDAFIAQECSSGKLSEIWNGVYPPKSIQALLRTLLVSDISLQNKHVIFVYLFMDITNVLSEGAYSSIVRNLIKFPTVFKMNPAMIKRTQAFWNLDNGHLDTAVEELISPLSHDKHLPLWQRELLIGALLKQNANSLALRALRCPGNQISSDLEMLTLLSNNLISEALKVQRACGDRRLLEKLFEKILHSPNFEQLLDLTLTEEEGSVLGEYLQKLKNTGLPNHLNIHFVFLLQRSKFLDAAQLVESLGNDSNMNLEPPKQVLNAYYASMESTTRKLTSMVFKDDMQVNESPLPLSVNLIRARCNAKNDIYRRCVQSINEAAYDNSQDVQSLPFIGNPKLGIFEYKQPTVNYQELSFSLEVNEHGKRKPTQKNEEFFRLEDLETPQLKRRRLDESAVAQKKKRSYMDMKVNNLTVFKEMKPNYSFVKRPSVNSLQSTPDRVQVFGNFLNTPIVQKKTPPSKILDKCPTTPHSILKTRSFRGSVSPAPSRFSEHGDDNKSVKSITFAALPDSRDTSLNESSFLEESINDEPMETFYSPGKSPDVKLGMANSQSIVDGPKARKSITSRSTTPTSSTQSRAQQDTSTADEPKAMQADEQLLDVATPAEASGHEVKVNDSISSVGSRDYGKPFRDGDVISDSSYNDSDDSSDSSVPEKSIYNYVRRSVLPDNYLEDTDSSEEDIAKSLAARNENKDSAESENVEDEQFEEEELPDHSDYEGSSDDENNGDFAYANDVDLDDSDESESQQLTTQKQQSAANSEVICLDSSSDEEIIQAESMALPSFEILGSVDEDLPSARESSKVVSISPSDSVQVVSSHEEMFATLYENLIDDRAGNMEIENDLELESPQFEEIFPVQQDENAITSSQPMLVESLEPMTASIDDHDALTSSEDVEKETLNEPEQQPDEQLASQEIVFAIPEVQESEFEAPVDQPEITSSCQEPEEVQLAQDVNVIEVEIPVEFKAPEEITSSVNTTEVSSEFSFASATGGELNDGILMSQILTDQASVISYTACVEANLLDEVLVNDDISMETARESVSMNPLDAAQIDEEIIEAELSAVAEPESPPAPTRRAGLRSKSGSVEPSDRLVRATSMPSSASSSPKSRSQRASTEDRVTVKKPRKPKALEVIEESATPSSSPGVLTRRRSQLLDNVESQDTPTRLTRRLSHLSEDGRKSTPPTTPRRLTRAASKESLAASEADKTPEEPGRLTRQPSKRIAIKRATSVSADENDDAKSTASTKSTRKKSTSSCGSKITPERAESVEPHEELSVSNRRLTRRQMEVIEKSRQLAAKMSSEATLRATQSDVILRSKVDDSDNETVNSDSESVASSRTSTSRKRKTAKPTKGPSSASSKAARRSTSPSSNVLSIIHEESHEESSESSVRGRRAKK